MKVIRVTNRVKLNNKLDNSIRQELTLSRTRLSLRLNCNQVKTSKTYIKVFINSVYISKNLFRIIIDNDYF